MKEKTFKETIKAKGLDISVISQGNDNDYISLTDIAKYRSEDPNDVIKNWLRNRETIEFLGLWEQLNNPSFKPVEFDGFRKEAGRNVFVLSPQKWIESTNAIGITSKSGRYGGTFAHKDIAFEFASWISPEFKLYIIKDYQRLKTDESNRLSIDWNVKRIIAKTNYKIHTDAIKENIIPYITESQKNYAYASEADLLNVALFGKTALQWKKENPDFKGNMRDYASITELLILSNLENLNAELIKENIPQNKRLEKLNKTAISQAKSLQNSSSLKALSINNKLLIDG